MKRPPKLPRILRMKKKWNEYFRKQFLASELYRILKNKEVQAMTTKWRINQITQRCLQAGWYQIFNEKGQMAGFCLHDEKTARKMAASSEMYEILKGLPFKLKANGADEREEIDEAIQEMESLLDRIDGGEAQA